MNKSVKSVALYNHYSREVDLNQSKFSETQGQRIELLFKHLF